MKVFDRVPVSTPNYSIFDLSHSTKMSLVMGKLVPILTVPTLPNDHWRVSSKAMLRAEALLAPMMHRVDIYVHYFYTPTRVVWPNFPDYLAPKSDTAIPPLFPVLETGTPGTNSYMALPSSLMDYMGMPVNLEFSLCLPDPIISAVPYACYQKIYDEYYRDQNFSESLFDPDGTIDLTLRDGLQTTADSDELCAIRYRCWEHDYFTAALPEPQKGPDVMIPFNFSASNVVEVKPFYNNPSGSNPTFNDLITGAPIPGSAGAPIFSDGTADLTGGTSPTLGTFDFKGSQVVNLDDAGLQIAVNDLRTAAAIQRYLERAARVGTRYSEVLKGFFDSDPGDATLQRPVYLGGMKSTLSISEVLQTSQSTTGPTGSPQGQMAGHGIAVGSGSDFSYTCKEHGYIIGIMSVMPKTAYHQGIPRHFLDTVDRYQLPWPDLQNLGEEPVYNVEVCMSDINFDHALGTFGYMPRYSHYRYHNDRIAGQMHDSLKYWSLVRDFDTSNPPTLNNNFVEASDVSNRVFAVQTPGVDNLLADILFDISVRRPLTKYGIPGSIV